MAASGTGDRGEMHFALRLGNVPLGRVARVIRRRCACQPLSARRNLRVGEVNTFSPLADDLTRDRPPRREKSGDVPRLCGPLLCCLRKEATFLRRKPV
jgi:hypothetical protein